MENTNVYITDLPMEVDDEKLVNIFSAYGTVTWSRVFEGKGKPTKAAIVEFADVAEARWVVENLNGNIAEGLTEPINVAFKRDRRKGDGKGFGKADSKGYGKGDAKGYGKWGGDSWSSWGGKGDGKGDGKGYGKADAKGYGKGYGKDSGKGKGKWGGDGWSSWGGKGSSPY
uniref:RRM domain-containing protein n=1 Tax=Alexandrium monilatum TaxID=311494 RepID=A0A7S4VF06_9DINO|eukprot:CAMPEP_0175205068 /NCGR_PEP_ID=MMETSP0093-20121207/11898_1 /TAXON_ID=311494 /ORGANISM="Alexandrium monilatum, Strain CCMP3105" /LENGTH=170 /DNA_ID=CAMNT_0016498173 /DNA_START=92 /DNA_END=604 /DNA_ORIENTATION=+